MPFREQTIYFVANDKLRKALKKDPVLGYNLHWIKRGSLEDAKLPGKGLLAVRNVFNPENEEGPYFIPWDAIWSKQRQEVQFFREEASERHPPLRMLERIAELVRKYQVKAFFYSCETHGGHFEQEYAWIFSKDHITILDDGEKRRTAYINGKKVKLSGNVLYLALKEIGVKTKRKSGWFEPHASPFAWQVNRLSPKINSAIETPPFSKSLYRSATLGDQKAVRKCLKQGISPLQYRSILRTAAASGNTKLVELLLKQRVKVQNGWYGPLNVAQNKATIKLLLKNGAELNHASNPLAHIAESGNEEAVRYMIKKGAEVRLAGEGAGENMLWFAACQGGILFLVKQLFPLVDPECTWISGTGVTVAAAYNRLKVVQWLLKKGVKLHQETLLEAAKNGQVETVKWLLQHTEIDVNGVGTYGDTALYKAANYGRLAMVDLLLSQGADPNQRAGYYDFSPLHAAAFMGSIPLLERLLAAGIPIDCEANDKRTALWIAVSIQAQKAVDYLLERGASLDASVEYHGTVEEVASRKSISLSKVTQS